MRLDHLCQVSTLNPDLFVRLGQLARGEWNDAVVNLLQFCVAAAALAAVVWGHWLRRTNRAGLERAAHRLLLALGFVGGLAYFNFGQFHFGDVIHTWDTYHYYVGAKYFPELGYERLYDCAVAADAESATSPAELTEIRERLVTDLRTNTWVKGDVILKNAAGCKDHFSDSRWRAFAADVHFFRNRVDSKQWVAINRDHGFNATPVWTLLGGLLVNTGPATKNQIRLLWLLDPLYLMLMAAMLWWAFGPQVFAIALIVLGTNYPNRYYYTGGAYLRYDWLFYLVAVVCLLKKEKFALAGASLAYSTLLRLFPGLLLIGPLVAGLEFYRRRHVADAAQPTNRLTSYVDQRLVRFLAGGAAATAFLLALTLASGGGITTWKLFAANTVKHAGTPLTNHMGLRTVLSYRPADTAAHTRNPALTDPWLTWADRRVANFNRLKPLYWVVLLACCTATYLAIRRARGELWVSAALGAGLIAFASELTCYYYCFLIALTPLYNQRREVGTALIGLAATTQAIAFTGMTPQTEDVPYVAMSAVTLFAIASVWWMFISGGSPAEPVATRARRVDAIGNIG